MASPVASIASPSRVIRVFVSSTFRDMEAERDELVKRTFPQLRKLCETRGVTWGEVDLRWGVTDEQKSEGKVLPICLAEIRRCRPYFIGLLGERYGWVPEDIPQGLQDEEPWLGALRGRSVTELEILQGVLNDSAMTENAFFYFRSPAYLDSLPREQMSAFQESSTPDDIAQFGAEEAAGRAELRKEKLIALKQRLRGSGLPVREDYPNPQTLGELVLADLTSVIDRVFPEDSAPDPLDQEAAEHEAFAQSRARVYIGRREYFDRLDDHARSNAPPLVVLGESGLGKSALLANWAVRYRAAHPSDLLVQHFIGASPASADWAAMLRRILGEFKRRFGLTLEIPDKPDALRLAFANALNLAAANGPLVLILDALNQLDDHDQAPDLVWLPPEIPANVRLILSTLPGRPLDDLKKRNWPVLQVEPLTTSEREQLINEYLAQYTKWLSAGRVGRIAAAPQTANPLYLRAMLEELRLWHEHETLEGRIDHYLSATSVPELYRRILERYEQDYERDRPGLVRDAMSLLWAARRGLSEAELMELLGNEGQALPGAYWSPLYLAAEQSLVNRSGLLGFFHDYLRDAVRDRYLSSDSQQVTAHLRLADFFSGREMGARKLAELPWQLGQARSWERLADLLTDAQFFEAAWKNAEFEVKAYWTQIEANSELQMTDAYRLVEEEAINSPLYAWRVTSLLQDAGHLPEASGIARVLAEVWRATENKTNLHPTLAKEAGILYMRGEADKALALHQEVESICRELGDQAGLHRSLGDQALILCARGELDQAMALSKEKERICRELDDKIGLAASLGCQAAVQTARGEMDLAMALHKEEERISRELGDKKRLGDTLCNQAVILKAWGELDQAMGLLKEQERITLEMGDRYGFGCSLGQQAAILYSQRAWDQAMALLKEQERISRDLGNRAGLGASLGAQALILYARGELDHAMALQKEDERIRRELNDKAGLGASLGNQAVILLARGELDEAMALNKEAERLCRELGDKAQLASNLGNQAAILYTRGELDEAMPLFKQQEFLCRELGDKAGLASSLGNQGVILYSLGGELDEPMELYREQERLCRELGDQEGLQACLDNQALILEELAQAG